jgi:hypothetical protein
MHRRFRGPDGDLGGSIPNDDGAGHQIPEPLGTGMERYQDSADQIGWREEIGGANQVANGRGSEGDRMPGIAHHADSQAALPWSLTVTKPLEEGEIAPERCEIHQREDRPGPVLELKRQQREDDQQCHGPPDQDQGVDDGGERA